jgi:hypothetical protein
MNPNRISLRLITTAALIFCFVKTPAAESRFMRILLENRELSYEHSYRDLNFGVYRFVDPVHSIVDSNTLDTSSWFSKEIYAQLGYRADRGIGDMYGDVNIQNDINAAVSHSTSGFGKRGYINPSQYCTLGICFPTTFSEVVDSDTVAITVGIDGSHILSKSHYFDSQATPYVRGNAEGRWDIFYKREENDEPFTPDSFMHHKYYLNSFEILLNGNVTADAGFGRRRNVSPVYQAFSIEKALEKYGAARFELSDSSMSLLSQLAGSLSDRQIKKHSSFKLFKSKLDSIVTSDAAGSAQKLKFLSQFQLKRLLLRKTPDLFAGPTAGIRGRIETASLISRFEKTFPFDTYEQHDDATGRQVQTFGDITASAYAACGIPAGPFVFIDMAVVKRLLSFDKGFFMTDTAQTHFENIFSTDWNISAVFLINRRIMVHIGCEHAPALYLVVPQTLPYHSWLDIDVQIEDNLSLQTSFFAFNSDIKDLSLAVQPFRKARHGLGAKLTAIYGF